MFTFMQQKKLAWTNVAGYKKNCIFESRVGKLSTLFVLPHAKLQHMTCWVGGEGPLAGRQAHRQADRQSDRQANKKNRLTGRLKEDCRPQKGWQKSETDR